MMPRLAREKEARVDQTIERAGKPVWLKQGLRTFSRLGKLVRPMLEGIRLRPGADDIDVDIVIGPFACGDTAYAGKPLDHGGKHPEARLPLHRQTRSEVDDGSVHDIRASRRKIR